MSGPRELDPSIYVHPTAIVDDGAIVGQNSRIWHFCHVASGAVLGADCSLGQNVYVAKTARLGAGCRIQNNVSLYDEVILEDDVFCGPSAVFTNVINPRAHIPRKSEYRRTLVRKGATIGANATIVCGVELGRYCFVAAGAVVTKNVPAYRLVAGVPARPAGWICSCGEQLRERKGDARVCGACGTAFREGANGELMPALDA